MDPEILLLARRVRRTVRSWARHNPDINMDGQLEGGCAVASWALHRTLQARGVKSTFVVGTYSGSSHCWVEVGRYIIDVTATQFSDHLPAVYVTSKRSQVYKCEKRGTAAYAETKDWDHQSPIRYERAIDRMSS